MIDQFHMMLFYIKFTSSLTFQANCRTELQDSDKGHYDIERVSLFRVVKYLRSK